MQSIALCAPTTGFTALHTNFKGHKMSMRRKSSLAAPELADGSLIDTSDMIRVKKKAAFFDVDGTICKTNVVIAYFTARVEELPVLIRLLWVPWFVLTCIFYVIIDWYHRPTFNRIFYKSYKGRTVASKSALADTIYNGYYKPRMFKDAALVIERLKEEGFKVVLVTGSLDFLVAPLAKDLNADYVYAAELIEENGRMTGNLKGMFASNEEKAMRLKSYCEENEILLSNCLAFGDSIADLPMLECVGKAFVVNPDSRLKAIALTKSWPVLQWKLQRL